MLSWLASSVSSGPRHRRWKLVLELAQLDLLAIVSPFSVAVVVKVDLSIPEAITGGIAGCAESRLNNGVNDTI